MPILSLIYQFVIGGIIFFAGLIISWRSGDYSWTKREDRRTFVYLAGGFLLYLIFQTIWHFFALGKK
jgi:hypothetical protein